MGRIQRNSLWGKNNAQRLFSNLFSLCFHALAISLNHKIFDLCLNICLFSFNIFASGVHVRADKFKFAKSSIFHFLNFLMYDLFVS